MMDSAFVISMRNSKLPMAQKDKVQLKLSRDCVVSLDRFRNTNKGKISITIIKILIISLIFPLISS